MEKLDELCLVGEKLLQLENEIKEGGIWLDFFLAAKIRYCLSIKIL